MRTCIRAWCSMKRAGRRQHRPSIGGSLEAIKQSKLKSTKTAGPYFQIKGNNGALLWCRLPTLIVEQLQQKVNDSRERNAAWWESPSRCWTTRREWRLVARWDKMHSTHWWTTLPRNIWGALAKRRCRRQGLCREKQRGRDSYRQNRKRQGEKRI